MIPQMRRKDRQLSDERVRELLIKGEYGVLSTAAEDGQCYATPLSYVFLDGDLYFHCAKNGQKIRNIEFNPRVCFTVVDSVKAVYNGDFTTQYESVMVFGTVSEAKEKQRALLALCEKYLPGHMDKAADALAKSVERTAVYRISIEHMTGKGNV